jgi:hypothetical protein
MYVAIDSLHVKMQISSVSLNPASRVHNYAQSIGTLINSPNADFSFVAKYRATVCDISFSQKLSPSICNILHTTDSPTVQQNMITRL